MPSTVLAQELSWRHAQVNGQPGILVFDSQGMLVSVVCLDLADGHVQTIRAVAHPGKLRYLGPVAPLTTRHSHRDHPGSPTPR
jgi:RNA polymerase sigma-70 factor (ECF subfamily)